MAYVYHSVAGIKLSFHLSGCWQFSASARLILCAEQLTDGSAALLELAKKVNATSPVESQPQQPQKSVYLGEEFVNNKTLADVTFQVEGRPFYAHRIALLASSDHFKAMFNQVCAGR